MRQPGTDKTVRPVGSYKYSHAVAAKRSSHLNGIIQAPVAQQALTLPQLQPPVASRPGQRIIKLVAVDNAQDSLVTHKTGPALPVSKFNLLYEDGRYINM